MQSTSSHRRPPRASRRGVLLLVVLSLLVLFMLIGTAFMMSSSQYQHSATASAKLDRLGTPPTKLLDRALMQVLSDTTNPNSVIRSHSLLRDLYGSEGFEAEVYQPRTFNATPAGQATRFAAATTGTPAQQLGPTQGQLIDIYVKVLTFGQDDPVTTGVSNDEANLLVPDTRHGLKLEPNVNGQPQAHQFPLTKGYYNGCLLTMTSGPAAGQSTRIVDYEFLGDINVSGGIVRTRLFRFRVMAFPRSDGAPLTIDSANPPEIKDLVVTPSGTRTAGGTVLRGHKFIVNGRPFNGTGAGFNELAKAGEPRLNAVETVLNPDDPTDPTKALFPQVALAPNHAFTILNDPAPTGNDLVGVGYFRIPGDPTSWAPLNPKNIALPDRPLRWKYQTPAGPGDADESYDAPDFQNMALAMQTVTPRNRGRVVQEGSTPLTPEIYEVDSTAINRTEFLRLDLEDLPLPSFHRPDLVNYWFHRLAAFAAGVQDGAPVPPGTIQDVHVRAVLAPYGPDGIRGNGDDPTGVDLAVRDQIAATRRKFIMRPLREDHPNFDGSNPASRPPDLENVSNLVRNNNIAVPFWEAVGPWDVDNDNDGVRDSIWVDLGDPVTQAEDGTLYKPLYAFLVVDLDSRLNVNAHGLVEDMRRPILDPTPENPSIPGQSYGNLANDISFTNVGPNSEIGASDKLPHGLGYGPAEISLRPILSPNLPGGVLAANIGNPGFAGLLNADDYARLLVGRPASNGTPQWPSVWGRFGSVQLLSGTAANALDLAKPGKTFALAAANATTDVLPWMKLFGYPRFLSDLYNINPALRVPSAFSTPPDLMGRYALGLDYTGQPVAEAFADFLGYGNRLMLGDSPYELDLSSPRRRDTADPIAASAIAATAGSGSPVTADDDAPFATADLERILRAHDADSGILPDRLWNVVDAFDPLKLYNPSTGGNQPAAVAEFVKRIFNDTRSISDIVADNSDVMKAQKLAAAQQIAGVNRRLVTTDSYDLPVPSNNLLKRLVYGADGQPGVAGQDDDGANGADDPRELGWYNSDDWYAVMYHQPLPLPPPAQANFNPDGSPKPLAGVRLAPENPTIVDLLRYRIQYERRKQNLPIFPEDILNQIVQQLLAPELLAGQKMDLNRPFGDGVDNAGNGIDDNGDGRIDEPGEPGDPFNLANGIVDDPAEAGEPFLDANGNGKWDNGEKWIDMDADGQYDPPRDQLWFGLAGEPIKFDYTQGQAVPLHSAAGATLASGGGVRNLNSQGRQLYARHLYCLAMLLMDENYLEMPDLPSLDGNNLNLELQLMDTAVANGGSAFASTNADKLQVRRKLTAKRIAQWAINVVDFRDADAIMTAFEYDENPWDGWGCLDGNGQNIPLDGDVSTDENFGQIIDWENVTPASGASNPPTKPIINVPSPPAVANRTRGVVWGVERPELLITETLALHDRRCTDEIDYGQVSVSPPPNARPEERDYDLDQRLKPRGSLYVELYNPWSGDGSKPREFYGNVPASGVEDQGVMLNRLSDRADPVTNKYSPVWRMSVLREPLNGRLPVFKNLQKKLDSGVIDLTTGFPMPAASDQESLSADFLTVDPDGYNLNMDEAAERHVYFTTGRNYATGLGSDVNRSDDDQTEYEPSNPLSVGDWQFKDATGINLPLPRPVVNQLQVRVPPLPPHRAVHVMGTTHYVPRAKRYFIARTERIDDPAVAVEPNDIDVTIAPILPGRYSVVGSSGLQLRGIGAGTTPTPDGQVTDRFVTPLSRDASQLEDANGDRETLGNPGNPGRLPRMRRIELWPDATGRPDVNQVLIAENGGPEFIRIDNGTVRNVTDPDRDGNPNLTGTVQNPRLIDPAVAIPVEDLNVSEPVEGYPSIAFRRLIEINNPLTSTGLLLGFPEPSTSPRLSPGGVMVYPKPYEVSPETGELYYPTPYDRPLDTDFELVRNGTTQNYRSVHLQRLADPTLPWNPPPFDSTGNPNALHRSWLPVNPYRTIDSQSVDLTAYNGASTRERTELPVSHTTFSQDLTTDKLQSNVLAPITATQFLDAPDHEIWAMILLMKLKGISVGNSPEELRGAAESDIDAVEGPLSQLEAIEPGTRAELTSQLQETGVLQQKFANGMQQGWNWHMYRRVLPDDMLSGASLNSFRQWLHFKSLERGAHASVYFKYPKPGAFYAANPQSLEGWAPDLSVVPRTLWKQERPNARLFLQGPTGIVDASDLETVTSWRKLSGKTPVDPTELAQEQQSTPDSKTSRNQLIWSQLAASASAGTEPGAVFDYILEQTLGFANRSYTPDLEREDGDIASAIISSPKPGAPEVAVNSDRRPANPLTYETTPEREIWNYQRQAAKLQTAPNPPTPQPSLLQAVVNDGTDPALETQLVDEFYERRRILTRSTFPWFTWNDRPMVSAEEVLQVPAASSSLMLRDYSVPNRFTANPYDGNPQIGGANKTPAQQLAAQAGPFGHLLNVFASFILPAQLISDPLAPTGAPNFARILDYVEVPSRYVGTETLLSPEVFNDPVGNDITSPNDPRFNLQPPFNKVSRQRDPGRVNLNTITSRRLPPRIDNTTTPSITIPAQIWSEVYDGVMHRFGDERFKDSNLVNRSASDPSLWSVFQLGHFGPAWRDVVLSRRGYAQYNATDVLNYLDADPPSIEATGNMPDVFSSGLNKDFPSLYSNPFRSADAGDLVPLPNMVRPGVDATLLRGIHWSRADDNTLQTNPFASSTTNFNRIAWGEAGVDDDLNGIVDDIREAGFGDSATSDSDPLFVDGATKKVKGSGIPLFSEQVPEPAIDGERNPGMMYQPMTRLGNLVTTRSNVYAIWVTVGYFEVEKAPDWNDPLVATRNAVRARFGGTANDADDETIRARALYDRVYPDGYMLGEELGTDTGNTNRQRAFYIIDRTEPVGFKPGEDLNVDKMIRVRRRIE